MDSQRPLGLRPARSPVKMPRTVTALLLLDLAARGTWLADLINWHMNPQCLNQNGSSCDLLGVLPLGLTLSEMVVSMLLLNRFGRWEDQGHLITCWQVLSAVMVFVMRRSLYAQPILYMIAMLTLFGTYVVGIMAELRENTEVRLPPFCPKKVDHERPKYGWLGPRMASLCHSKLPRVAISFVIYISSLTGIGLLLYFGTISVEDDLRFMSSDLDLLFQLNIVAALVCLLPNIIVLICTWPDLLSDIIKMKKSSDAYRTGPYDMCSLDDDLREDSELRNKLKTHTCRPLTLVLPAYMPNEEDILMDILDFYRKRGDEYPGEFHVMLVWNSPNEHPEIEAQLQELAHEWPSLTVLRNTWSTSKCDNLNVAIRHLETEMALLNDADTLVSTATMCRASINMFEGDYDVVQSHNIHCWEDFSGRPESGCFPFGFFTTLGDASKPLNMSVQGFYKHSPFNGRGGFWRRTALKHVEFDHRIIGEDHDAAYRAFAYYGFKGILDPNMLCMEREPPNCKALVNQRTRWETAALEMRRTFPWVLRSEHYSKFEAFLLIWSQLSQNAQMPFQQLPLQMCQLMPLAVTKSYLSKHVFGATPFGWKHMCHNEDCLATFTVNGVEIALPVAVVAWVSIFLVLVLLWTIDVAIRTTVTRYRPRALWCCFTAFIAPFVAAPFRMYVQFWAMHDFCWGSAKFICTERSSVVVQGSLLPKGSIDPESLRKPLLESNATLSTMVGSGVSLCGSNASLSSISGESDVPVQVV